MKTVLIAFDFNQLFLKEKNDEDIVKVNSLQCLDAIVMKILMHIIWAPKVVFWHRRPSGYATG